MKNHSKENYSGDPTLNEIHYRKNNYNSIYLQNLCKNLPLTSPITHDFFGFLVVFFFFLAKIQSPL